MNRYFNSLQRFLGRSFMRMTRGDYWHFWAVYIETVQQCNRRCHYCPQSIAPFKKRDMTGFDLETAVSRLSDIGWSGDIFLSRFGEPLLDDDLENHILEIKSWLPKCRVSIYSNGDILTANRCESLVRCGLDRCLITKHQPRTSVQDIHVSHAVRFYPKVFKCLPSLDKPYTIAGLNPEAKAWTRCTLPSWAFIINPNLDVTLCCHDYHREHVFGNLTSKSIYEIWNQTEFKRIRQQLREGKPEYAICKQCFGQHAKKADQLHHVAGDGSSGSGVSGS